MSQPETPASRDEELERVLQSTIETLRQEFEGRLAEARGEMRRLIDEIQAAQARRREAEEVPDVGEPAGAWNDLLEAVIALDQGSSQAEILAALVAGSTRFADRSALFLTTSEGLLLWASDGFPEAPGEPLNLPWERGPWSELSQGRGTIVLSAEECGPICQGLAGAPAGTGVAVPLVLRDRIAAALYADRLDGGGPTLPALQLLTLIASQALETLPLRNRDATPSLHLASSEAAGPGLPLWDPDWAAEEAGGTEETPLETAAEPTAGAARDEPSMDEVDLASLPDASWTETDTAEGVERASAALEEETLPAESVGLEVEEMDDLGSGDQELVEEEAVLEHPDRDDDEAWIPVDLLTENVAEGPDQEIADEIRLDEVPADEVPAEEIPAEEVPVEEIPVEEIQGPAVEEVSTPLAAAEEAPAVETPGKAQASFPGGFDAAVEVVPPEDLQGPGSAFATPPLAASGDEADQHEDARRLARLLVSELMLYNETEVLRGRREGNVYRRIADEVDRSRDVYDQRVDQRIRRTTDYFREELVRVLASGDPGVLGV